MITEDPTVFLQDFGVSVVAGAVSGVGIFDMPGEAILDGMVITTSYRIRCLASLFGSLPWGSGITVDAAPYRVQEVRLVDDGLYCDIALEKITVDEIIPPTVTDATYIVDGDFL